MSDAVDLDVLQRRVPVSNAAPKRVRNRIVSILVAAGLLGTAYVVLKPILYPPPTVRVVRVRPGTPATGIVRSAASSVVAAGWLEADPFPVSVRPLLKGVVQTLNVLEAQEVVAGETVIATIANLDVSNELDLAKAAHLLAEASVTEAQEALTVAQRVLEQNLAPRQRVIDLEGSIDTAGRDVARAEARKGEAARAIETAQVDVDAQDRLVAAGGGAPVALARARAKLAEAVSHTTELDEDANRLRRSIVRLEALLTIAKEGRDNPRGLEGEVRNRSAALARARAAVEAAKTRVLVAERNVTHLTVIAPMSGVVLRLNCAPGAVVGPQGEFMGAGEAGATGGLNRLTGAVVTLYDPSKIQARVDVPLADVAGLTVGTDATVEVDAAKGIRFEGKVTRLVHEADLSKNTLQVKVRVTTPKGLLRPEMLCRARFDVRPKQADADPGAPKSQAGSDRTWMVPSAAVRNGAVLVYDPRGGGMARRVSVTVVSEADGNTRVQGELGRSTRVVLDEVAPGARIKAKEEAQ